ncbi:MAG: hypothetical protein CSYNP_01646 [Syntrophus sp. SKADARSKE-3]|nr:hypothetical protein [Syntrophus sp. SKADARSKE-3]
MPTRFIHCNYCGQDGEIEICDLEAGVPESKIFKYFGHNPFSGHMHFRCPACEIILLVHPIAVLGEEPLEGSYTMKRHNKHFHHQHMRHFFCGNNLSERH